jgi:hypothetical protein
MVSARVAELAAGGRGATSLALGGSDMKKRLPAASCIVQFLFDGESV